MSKLRLLKLSNVQLPKGLDYLSNDLRLLDWHGYPSNYLPSNFQPNSLVTLKMSSSCLKQPPWNGRMCLDKLNYVDLSYSPCITKNLDFTQIANLKKLILEGCMNLVEIDPSIEALSNLQFISLRDCRELTSLPSGICGFKLLATLIVSGCSKLSRLPENLGGLERLEELYADFTTIKQPPSSIIHLKELRVLSFVGCKGPITSTLWNSLFSSFLIWKERQDPMGFELPALSGLCSLFFLRLQNCNFSEGFLPNDLGSLSHLRYLYLSGTDIISLPASIRDLYLLYSLELIDCKKLKTLPYLPTNITCLKASGCTSLETFPDPPILPRKLLGGFVDFPECTIVGPGREIPKCFSYQNDMGHYVRIQLMPDWYQRLRGFVVCAVFEAKAPSIDAYVSVGCYGMCNDVVVYATDIGICSFQFQSDHLVLDYMDFENGFVYFLGETRRRVEVNELKTWTEIIFYFSSCSEIFVPVKCAVHMVYENDEEWLDPLTCLQPGSIEWIQAVILRKGSRHNYDYQADTGEQPNSKRLRNTAAQWRDSQSELSETLIQNIRDADVTTTYYVPRAYSDLGRCRKSRMTWIENGRMKGGFE